MANSIHQITDIAAIIATGPNAATQAKVLAAAGPIQDYVGNLNMLLLKLYEAKTLCNIIIAGTDATDATNLGLLQNVVNDLV